MTVGIHCNEDHDALCGAYESTLPGIGRENFHQNVHVGSTYVNEPRMAFDEVTDVNRPFGGASRRIGRHYLRHLLFVHRI